MGENESTPAKVVVTETLTQVKRQEGAGAAVEFHGSKGMVKAVWSLAAVVLAHFGLSLTTALAPAKGTEALQEVKSTNERDVVRNNQDNIEIKAALATLVKNTTDTENIKSDVRDIKQDIKDLNSRFDQFVLSRSKQ